MYRIFGFTLHSDFPLPELTALPGDEEGIGDISFHLASGPLPQPNPIQWLHHWYTAEDNSEITLSVGRQNGQYLLRFPDLADFIVDLRRGKITAYACTETPMHTLRHLLLDQVIPRFVGQQGKLVLHASAIVLADGACVAFLGASGWGKSTLASSFHQHGAQLLTDDSIKLHTGNRQLLGTPSYAGSRLWQDSAETVYPDHSQLSSMTSYSDKTRLVLRARPGSCARQLRALFILNNPVEAANAGNIKIKAVAGAQMIMALLRQTFLIDTSDKLVVAKHFETASEIVQTGPAIYSLSYPRNYQRLADTRAAIVARCSPGF